MNHTVKKCLEAAVNELKKHSATSTLDAQILLSHALKKTHSQLIAWPDKSITSEQAQLFTRLLKRRINKEPIAYITEQQEFWSMTLKVSYDTLIPRPETELMVESALQCIPSNTKCLLADLGTGSGAIALALAKERPKAHIIATDISSEALNIAKKNASALRLNNIEFRQGNWYEVFNGELFDAIVTNPPYIRKNDPHMENLHYEPRIALTPEHEGNTLTDGLSCIRLIIEQGKTYLKKSGHLFIEHGHDQQTLALEYLTQANYHNIQGHQDLAKKPRFVSAQQP